MALSQPRRPRESERKSILQVLQANFSYYDRNTYIHRFIYIGEIGTKTENSTLNPSAVMECFEKSIKPINDRYCDEPVTGFLLYFGNRFCHVLESSEESLVRHLRLLKENERIGECFDKFKLVIVYHHMNQRFIDEWVPLSIDGYNRSVLKSPENAANLEETMLKVKCLIEKLYTIGNSLKVKVEESKAKMRAPSRHRARMKSPSSDHLKIAMDVSLLPEYEDLEILVSSPHTKPLSVYLEVYNNVRCISEGNYWPAQEERIPNHIFEAEVNPVDNLPANNID